MIDEKLLALLAQVGYGLLIFAAGHIKGYFKGMRDPRDKHGRFRARTWRDYLP